MLAPVRLKSHVRLIGLVALSGLAIGLALLLRAELGPLRTAQAVAVDVRMQAALADLVHELQRERGLTAIRLASGLPMDELQRQQDRTDALAARARISGVLREGDLSAVAAQRHRIGIDATDGVQTHVLYTAGIDTLLRRFAVGARSIEIVELRGPLLAHLALLRAKEQLGQLRALVAGQLAGGESGERDLRRALQQLAVFDAAVAICLEEMDAAQAGQLRAVLDSAALRRLRDWLADYGAGSGARPAGVAAALAWFDVASAALDELHALGGRASDDLEALVALADAALYRAKTLGRNRVCRASTIGGDEPRLRLVPA